MVGNMSRLGGNVVKGEQCDNCGCAGTKWKEREILNILKIKCASMRF